MIIRDFGSIANGEARVILQPWLGRTASIPNRNSSSKLAMTGSITWLTSLAQTHSYPRVFLSPQCTESRGFEFEGQTCPMLVEGLYTAHAWWTSWGGPPAMPSIETSGRLVRRGFTGDPRGVAFLSGGVDSLHMLMRNHRLYRPEDPAYIRDALFIHGFDIGKRARDRRTSAFARLCAICNL